MNYFSKNPTIGERAEHKDDDLRYNRVITKLYEYRREEGRTKAGT